MIEVTHLTKRYGKHTAVDDISFTVEDGCIYGLLGPNGAGKSTTMNILTGYLSASDGTVKIDGHDIVEDAAEAKACIGYLPEQPPLYQDMTVTEYLLFVAELKGVRKKAERRAGVEKVCARTGAAGDGGAADPQSVQRIPPAGWHCRGAAGVHRRSSFWMSPRWAWTPAQMIEIRSQIHDLGKTHTVILSSHILSEVQTVCDRVLIIAQGKLIAQGTPEELAGKGLAAKGSISATAQGSREAVLAAAATVPGIEQSSGHCRKGRGSQLYGSQRGREPICAGPCRWRWARANCPVLNLSAESMSLEDVFLQLTEHPEEKEET